MFASAPVQQALMEVVFSGLEYLVLASARPFGMTLFFAVFAWAHLNSGVLRMIFAIAVALPVVAPLIGFSPMGQPELPYPYALVLLKELLIGGIFGWIASLPFAIVAGGGHIIDGYRGGMTGDTDPSGGQITPYAKLFTVIALALFALLNGFWIITDMLYATYVLWPLFDPLPLADGFRLEPIYLILESLMRGALVLAAPMLTVMFASDLIFLFAAKFGKQINISHLAFSVKNIIVLLLLPVFGWILLRLLKDEMGFFSRIDDVMQGILP